MKYKEIQNERQLKLKQFKQHEDGFIVKVKELDLERKVLSNKLKERETVRKNIFVFFE